MQTPSPNVGVHDDDGDDDMDGAVPIIRLGDGTLGKLSVDAASSSNRRPKQSLEKVTILDDEAMPGGAGAVGTARASSRSIRKNSEEVTLEDIDFAAPDAEYEMRPKKAKKRRDRRRKEGG